MNKYFEYKNQFFFVLFFSGGLNWLYIFVSMGFIWVRVLFLTRDLNENKESFIKVEGKDFACDFSLVNPDFFLLIGHLLYGEIKIVGFQSTIRQVSTN